ncbi:unnamed protein product [Prunus armeniaca]|uniref:Uncharacterized protein n=1 Tax=Prunus armeniaca TaxID=36596 RepID=A0A6J5XWK8_PRUAR|nr:unnamed protein product [Prunus armeniaca]
MAKWYGLWRNLGAPYIWCPGPISMQELGLGLALARPHGSGPDEFWQGCFKEEKEKYGMGHGSIPADISVAGVLELGLGRKFSLKMTGASASLS